MPAETSRYEKSTAPSKGSAYYLAYDFWLCQQLTANS